MKAVKMNVPEWLPDWRDESQYPDAKTTSARQWAWEFLRRNRLYQAAFDTYARPFLGFAGAVDDEHGREYERKQKKGAATVAAKSGKTVTIYGPTERFKADFGILTPRAPERSLPPPFVNHQASIISVPGGKEFQQINIAINPAEVFAFFRLDNPLEPQIARFRKAFDDLVAAYAKKNKVDSPRYRPENFQQYLRILDGKAVKAKGSELAKEIFPKVISGAYGDATDRVRDGFNRAKLLRDGGYRQIALGSGK